MNNISECIICKAPLGQESRDSGFLVCHDHRKCTVCSKDVNARTIRVIVTQTQQHEDEITPDLIMHVECGLSLIEKSETRTTGILPTAAELDLSNRYRLCLHPDLSLSEDENTGLAKTYTSELVKDMSLDAKFLLMRRLQICAAHISILMGDKNRKAIQEELKDKQKKEYEQVKRIREKAASTVKESTTNTYGYSAKVWDNMSKVEKKFAKEREQGIQALVKFGYSREAAAAEVDKHKIKMAKG